MEKPGSGSCIMNLSMQLTAPSYIVTGNLLLNSSHFTSKLYGSQITVRTRYNLFCDYRAYWVLHRSSPTHLVSRALESHSPPADSVECSFRINPIIQRRRMLRQKYHHIIITSHACNGTFAEDLHPKLMRKPNTIIHHECFNSCLYSSERCSLQN